MLFKNKIVIASILKPVNDARMYEKFAISLSSLQDVQLSIYGFKTKKNPEYLPDSIQLNPIFDFPRLSWARLISPWKFYKHLLKEKPEILIVTTHELLIVSSIYKILFGGKIIYDVQENYYRNIAFTDTFPLIIRNFLAIYVRAKEWLTRPFINHYLLAEKNYEKEFSFTRGKSTVIENKSWMPDQKNTIALKTNKGIKFLYSGTISKEYGIFEAIQLVQKLHNLNNSISLTIIGYGSNNQTLKEIKESIKSSSFIRLIGGDQLVPHQEILQAIQEHDVSLLPYKPNKSTINCIPTKLYENLAYRLPMLVNQNPIWDEIIQKYDAGLSINYSDFNAELILKSLTSNSFFKYPITDEIYWEAEQEKLLKVIENLI